MIRKASDRSRTKWDWLDSQHTFSFDEYFDPQNMGFRSLRVINDDLVQPGQGFGTHPHRDMEILTYVLASPTGADGSVRIHQDTRLYLGELAAGQSSRHALAPGRGAWVHLIEGRVVSSGQTLAPGDALGLEDESLVEIAAQEPARFLLFDLA